MRATSSTAAPAPYRRVEGLHVLRVSGDDYEMGYQHGAILKQAIRRGPVPYFERYLERMLGAGAGPRAGKLLAALLGQTVGRRIAAGFPREAREALNGLADGAELSRGALLRAVTMPESYLWVLRRLMDLRDLDAAPRHGVPLLGCTSAIAWGDATRDGKLLHGRNFDYQGVGAWDREQAVVFHRPSNGQPYVSVSAAGILFGGITAMNASGLTLAVHQHMASRDLRLGGVPIGVTGDQVMRHARSLDDAERILDAHRPNGCWTYLIASARERAVLVYEVSPARRASFRAEGDTFGYSNIFVDSELAKSELHLYPSHWRNNTARYRRVNQRLASERGRIDADGIAAMLGDLGDGCRLANAIAMPLTVASVVFAPDDRVVYVATGRAPVSTRPYLAFELDGETARPDLPALRGGVPADLRASEALDAYRDAYEAYFDDGDLPRARRHLDDALARAPEEAVYWFVAGLLALHAGDPHAAEAALDRAIERGHADGERRAAFHLWRARARDAGGRHADAIGDYRATAGGDAAVRRAARRGLVAPWRPRRFAIEFALGDVPTP
ncbi:MAG: C45 family autoproteolytic acyltransferase/hydrolase [Sorangiineae bacterium]|nr:C45 family autoproteolytic acyltransferase/hydrolase [Polyangiaceae bacterium]MEB2324776.1 C45 family autoproteolytic acyltransferase/hydrolase [Sorangiineae bacterium]